MYCIGKRCKRILVAIGPAYLTSYQTVGTLLSHAYVTGGCLLGAIFGTGTNGAFVEKTASFNKMGDTLREVKSEYMVVNTEWGAFDNEVGIRSNVRC